MKRFEADMLNADEKKRIDADVAEAPTKGPETASARW
jgi:hypothetical protein